MEWNKGYTASWYIKKIDPNTWRDLDTIQITGGSVTRETTNLRESADIDLVNAASLPTEQWIRVYLDTKQTGDNGHTAIFTGLAASPADSFDGPRKENQLECYSVLKPVDDVKLLRGWYAQAGRQGADIIKELLTVTPAPVAVAGESPVLTSHIIAEDDETHLTMIDRILDAINWRLRITGDGRISIEPQATGPVATFDPVDYDIVEPEVSVEKNLFDCPNVFLVIDDDLTAIARDDDENSPLSTLNRGREVWESKSDVSLAEGETIAQYAKRMLKEAQQIAKTGSYSRRYVPGIIPGDLVRLKYPNQNLDGVFTVSSQSIAMEFAGRTQESVTEYKL